MASGCGRCCTVCGILFVLISLISSSIANIVVWSIYIITIPELNALVTQIGNGTNVTTNATASIYATPSPSYSPLPVAFASPVVSSDVESALIASSVSLFESKEIVVDLSPSPSPNAWTLDVETVSFLNSTTNSTDGTNSTNGSNSTSNGNSTTIDLDVYQFVYIPVTIAYVIFMFWHGLFLLTTFIMLIIGARAHAKSSDNFEKADAVRMSSFSGYGPTFIQSFRPPDNGRYMCESGKSRLFGTILFLALVITIAAYTYVFLATFAMLKSNYDFIGLAYYWQITWTWIASDGVVILVSFGYMFYPCCQPVDCCTY